MNDFFGRLSQTRFYVYAAILLLHQAAPGLAQTNDEPTDAEINEADAIAADIDGSLDDADSSIDIKEKQRGFTLTADIRTAYTRANVDERDSSNSVDEVLRARWRVRSTFGFLPYLRGSARVAGLCSNVECKPNLVLQNYIPTQRGMADGDITLDEVFLQWYRLDKFDLALGRLQTKFVTRGGVFAKSLDRNDSQNFNVNWTDGLHGTIRARSGWVSHLILQHNAAEGATNVRRAPLDFDDSGARVSYFVAFENLERKPLFLQRALDISYLPKSLLKDGTLSGRREDYYGVVIRSANRWPERNDGIRLRVAAELGYAPNTQTKTATGLSGNGDTDGLAWNFVVSLMDFKPNHSIGVNYGQVGAGWLLSPQFRQNEWLGEIRYQWRRSSNLAFDFRIRKRKELQQLELADRKQEEIDFFIRFTWGRTVR